MSSRPSRLIRYICGEARVPSRYRSAPRPRAAAPPFPPCPCPCAEPPPRRPRTRGAAPCSWRARRGRRRAAPRPAALAGRAQHHQRGDVLAAHRVGHADDVRRLHRGMAGQRLLDLDRGDVDAGRLDDVLHAAAEVQVARPRRCSRDRRCERSPRRQRRGARHPVVALHQRRALDQDLAGLAGRRPARRVSGSTMRTSMPASGRPNVPVRTGSGSSKRAAVDAGRGLRHAVHADGAMIGAHQLGGERVIRAFVEMQRGAAKSGWSSSGPA